MTHPDGGGASAIGSKWVMGALPFLQNVAAAVRR
jgi:hypothetical protein